jgi:hypothetical protein
VCNFVNGAFRKSALSLTRALVFRFCEGFDDRRELDNFEVLGALGPVVTPANDYVTSIWRMAVVAEVPTFELKFNSDALPPSRCDLSLCFAVREPSLDGFH